ncbi:MAG: MerR family transcriptional regulator [Oscillospiraceae bacterium]|jgi:DNA-binding transcriptional MerR regulator|nr:MerR family transcriptional regulator [Oscillospiraceae bacterium]
MNGTELLSMKDFSEFTGIKQSALRYYDEIGLICPVQRGENNYRYYSPQQIVTINLIQTLTELDIPLKQIGKMEHCRTPEKIMDMLIEQEDLLDSQLRHIRECYSIIHTLNRMIHIGCAAKEAELTECELREFPIIKGPVNDFSNNKLFYETFIRFCRDAKKQRINLSYPVGGYFESADIFFESPSQPTCFFSMDPTGQEKKEAGHYLVAYVRGYYGEMGDSPQRLAAYAKEHALKFTGPLYVIYVLDEISVKEPKRYLAQVSVPVAPEKAYGR